MYYLLGVDLTAIEGIDELHALSLVSELGTDFRKWPTVKHSQCRAGLRKRPEASELEEDGGQGQVEVSSQ